MSSVRLGTGWDAYYFNVIGKAGYGLGIFVSSFLRCLSVVVVVGCLLVVARFG
jgi:hypothetical protein